MDYTATFNKLEKHCKQHNHRQLVVIAGEVGWGENRLETFIQHTLDADKQITRVSTAAKNHYIHPSLATTKLGSETYCIIFDAHGSFDSNAFAAISGTLRGGGLFFLLSPDLKDWPAIQPSCKRFIQRLIRFIHADKSVCLIQQNKEPGLPVLFKHQLKSAVISSTHCDAITKTPDQQAAVDTIIKMAENRTPYPVVITADRGRGKSAALGIAAAKLMSSGIQRIIITAPGFEVSKVFFQHLVNNCSSAKQHRGGVTTATSHCKFTPPDKLFLNPERADLVLVDEAAAIPAFILQRLLQHYPAIVFSTTTHGYEGSGQGFFIRFQQALDIHNPDWKKIVLETPIRWADNDPLENFTNSCLLLNTSPANIPPPQKLQLKQLNFTRIDLNTLAKDEQQLSEISGLLKHAHYRTRPSDMGQLLDAPESGLISCLYRQHIIAVIWFISEGGLSEDLAHEVYRGKRRPAGHLIPLSLTHHAGVEKAACLKYSRIVRIAVHPDFRRAGIGSRLLRKLKDSASCTLQTDIVGTSFGVTPELLKFWQSNDFVPARLGLKRNASSGTHSMIMLQPINSVGRKMTALLNKRFRAQVADTLELLQAGIDPGISKTLTQPLQDAKSPDSELINSKICNGLASHITREDQKDVQSFIKGYRGLELNISVLKKLIKTSQNNGIFADRLNNEQQKLLGDKLIKMRSNKILCNNFGFTGKQQLDSAVKNAVAILYSAIPQ